MKQVTARTFVVVTILLLPALSVAQRIAPVDRWAGQTGAVGSGHSGYLCSQDELAAFWKAWQIEAMMPEPDFGRELVVFYLGAGGPHLMSLSLAGDGNLVAEYVETPTVSLYPNYLIFTVSREGTKALNGRPVKCAE